MLNLVELGKIARPHGLRGHFLVSSHSGEESALASLSRVYVGRDSKQATLYNVVDSCWMPKGWKIRLEGIESDSEVKQQVGCKIYGLREDLPPTTPNEYYIEDLIGCIVIDSDTDQRIGTISGIELDCQQRWWVKTESGQLAIPASNRFIVSVNLDRRTIKVCRLSELL